MALLSLLLLINSFLNINIYCIDLIAGDEKLDYIVINKGNFEPYIRELLLVRHYRVEVYSGGAKTNNWTLDYKVSFYFLVFLIFFRVIQISHINQFLQASPGNLTQLEDVLFDNVDQVEGSAVIAIKLASDTSNAVSFLKNPAIYDKLTRILNSNF